MESQDLYEQLVGSAHDVYGRHPGHRALHAKGTWCEGVFTATPEAARLSRAFHLQGDAVPALVRFSNASGNPEAHDAERDGRGMAVKLRGDNGRETDILATTSPTFVTRTPGEFLELMRLRRPDPETGEPDFDKLGAFLAAHPEALPAAQATVLAEPLASFAAARYFSPHTFCLVSDTARTPVRWSWRPDAGEHRMPDEEARARGRDYLREDLTERLAGGTVGFDFELTLAEPDDPLEDPTAIWPPERETVRAGRLEISAIVADPEGDGHIHVFDPARIVDGVELSNDPILRARPHAYSVSAYERLDG